MLTKKQSWIIWDFVFERTQANTIDFTPMKGEHLVTFGRKAALEQIEHLNKIWGAGTHKLDMRWPANARLTRITKGKQ